MTETQRNLLSLLAHALFSAPTAAILTDEIKAEAQAQAVSSLITTDYNVLASNIRVLHAHAQLTETLSGIPFTTFKGYASAYYYPKPSYRPMGDVDFITAPEYYEEAVKRHIDSGCQKVTRHMSGIVPFVLAELSLSCTGVKGRNELYRQFRLFEV